MKMHAEFLMLRELVRRVPERYRKQYRTRVRIKLYIRYICGKREKRHGFEDVKFQEQIR